MDSADKNRIIENYRRLLEEHGAGPAVGQWSAEGQKFRFDKLAQIADLRGARVLDVGCGIGDFYPFLTNLYGAITYTGVDIVPELIERAAGKYPAARFICADLLEAPLQERFDYCFISGVFNNEMQCAGELLRQLVSVAYRACERGLAFNFTSDRVSRRDPGMAYHDPSDVLRFCLQNLSNKVILAHHYERCDVAMYVYRNSR